MICCFRLWATLGSSLYPAKIRVVGTSSCRMTTQGRGGGTGSLQFAERVEALGYRGAYGNLLMYKQCTLCFCIIAWINL